MPFPLHVLQIPKTNPLLHISGQGKLPMPLQEGSEIIEPSSLLKLPLPLQLSHLTLPFPLHFVHVICASPFP